jgi:hypothetical protein
MSNLEFLGRVAQKPPHIDEGKHSYFTGKWDRSPEEKPLPKVLEEVRVRDELPPDEY